jgi:hypothetical protein
LKKWLRVKIQNGKEGGRCYCFLLAQVYGRWWRLYRKMRSVIQSCVILWGCSKNFIIILKWNKICTPFVTIFFCFVVSNVGRWFRPD